MNQPLRLTGIGLRPAHYTEFINHKPDVAWLEVHAENYFGDGGNHLNNLEKIRKDFPISLHGVSLSIASTDDLNWRYLNQLKELIHRIDPCLVSDHLCWSSIDGHYLHDLLPFPFTDEALQHIVARIQCVQDFFKRPILIENVSRYVDFPRSTYTEWDFITTIAQRAGCGILLDVSNLYINSINLKFDPLDYLAAMPMNLIQEIHLGGFSEITINEKTVLVDTHDKPIVAGVWDLYQQAIQTLGLKPTIIEWDSNLPALSVLNLEAHRAEKIMRDIYAATKRTA